MEYFSKFANVLGYIYPQKKVIENINKRDDNINLLNKNQLDENIDKLIHDNMFYKNKSKNIVKINENEPLINKKNTKIIYIRKNIEEDS
jgi:hypothetical protein